MKRIILASKSPRRKEILSYITNNFAQTISDKNNLSGGIYENFI